MAKIIDITDKLNFDEKPKIRIRDRELEVNDDAVTVLRIMPKLSGNATPEAVCEIFELLFSEPVREEIKALNLSFKDFSTLIRSAVELVLGNDDEGEAQTPATT